MAMKGLHVCGTHRFNAGDPPPDSYLDRLAWADAQTKAGLHQARCGECGLWNFPQELARETPEPVCKKCDETERVTTYHMLIAAGYSDAEARGTAWPD